MDSESQSRFLFLSCVPLTDGKRDKNSANKSVIPYSHGLTLTRQIILSEREREGGRGCGEWKESVNGKGEAGMGKGGLVSSWVLRETERRGLRVDKDHREMNGQMAIKINYDNIYYCYCHYYYYYFENFYFTVWS